MENDNINKTEKKYNIPAIVFASLTVICAGVAIFFGIKYFEPKKEPEPVTAEKIEKEIKVEIVKETMANEYKEVENVVNSVTAGIENYWGGIENGNGLTYKPEGFDTYVPMKLDIKKKIKNSNTNEQNKELLSTALNEQGFNSIGILPFLGSAGPRIDGYYNAANDIVCGIYDDADWNSYNNASSPYLVLECAKTDWAWLTEADKALVAELATAYYEKEGEYPTVIYGLNDNIKNSQYGPYQTLTVAVGGAVGLFYRTSPDAKWQFFAGTQAVLGCDEYNTDDLKKAYLGEPCYNYDTQTDSTVQL